MPTRTCISCGKIDILKAVVRSDKCRSCALSVPRPAYANKPRKARYRMISVNRKRIYLHRHIMQMYLGRELTSAEFVHHLDGNRDNNDISNLELTNASEHMRHHVTERNELYDQHKIAANTRWGNI